MRVSVVIPVFNEEGSVAELYAQLKAALRQYERVGYEILFVDDGSTDRTAERVKALAAKDRVVKLLSFSENFGKAAALSVGFRKAAGDVIITMDGDLQDDSAEIPRFIAELDKGYDLVSGWKKERHDPAGKRIPSKFFNWLTALSTGVRIHDSNCGFKAYRRKVVEALTQKNEIHGELHRYIPALAHMKGFSVGEIVVNHRPRTHGRSKYGIRRLFSGFFDLVSTGVFTEQPLVFIWVGLFFLVLAMVFGIWVIITKFRGINLGNSPILTYLLVLSTLGLQSVSIGFLGRILNPKFRPTVSRRTSDRPLHLFGLLGISFMLVGLILAFWLISIGTVTLDSNRPLAVLIGLLFIFGSQLIMTGLLGDKILSLSPHEDYPLKAEINL